MCIIALYNVLTVMVQCLLCKHSRTFHLRRATACQRSCRKSPFSLSLHFRPYQVISTSLLHSALLLSQFFFYVSCTFFSVFISYSFAFLYLPISFLFPSLPKMMSISFVPPSSIPAVIGIPDGIVEFNDEHNALDALFANELAGGSVSV